MQIGAKAQKKNQYTDPELSSHMPQPTLDKVEKIIAVLGLLFFSGMFSQIASTGVVSIVRYIVWLGPTALMIFPSQKYPKNSMSE